MNIKKEESRLKIFQNAIDDFVVFHKKKAILTKASTIITKILIQ